MSEIHVCYKDISTGTETELSGTYCYNPNISNNTIVWINNSEIRYKNLLNNIEASISSSGRNPKISGNNVVWDDYSNGEYNDETGTYAIGTGHVYYKNLISGIEGRVSSSDMAQRKPAISDNIVVWEDYQNGNWDIYYATLPSAQPDLIINNISGPTLGFKGKTISITSSVKNIGTAAAGKFYTDFYLSKDANITTDDIRIYHDTFNSLNPGQTNIKTFILTVPSSITTGDYYIGAICDNTNIISESDETNNKKCAVNRINIQSRADLTISLYCPETGFKGKTISIPYSVINIGTMAAGKSYLYFYLSKDTRITSNDILVGVRIINSLNARQVDNTKTTTTLTIPTSLATGYYYLGAICDKTNIISESDETNNTFYARINIQSRPDLTIYALISPKTGIRGKTITIPHTIKNTGTSSATGFYTRFYLSKDTNINSTDIYLGQRYISSLKPGTSNTAKSTFKIPTKTIKGTYYLIAITDTTNKITESDEKNNKKYSTTKITIK